MSITGGRIYVTKHENRIYQKKKSEAVTPGDGSTSAAHEFSPDCEKIRQYPPISPGRVLLLCSFIG